MLAVDIVIGTVFCVAFIAWWMWRERRRFPREADRSGRAMRYAYIFEDKVVRGLFGTAAALGLGMLLMETWHIPLPPGAGFILAVPIVVAHIYRTRRRRAIADDVRRRGYRLCPMCQYSLEGGPPEGRCPECGQTYTREYLTNEWEASFREWRW